ncbi:hypothetical protein [Xanthomonas sacchari]|uniref:hypothetical protein n=1 Tax=Xanthomonas sacchari TaxID=56458 RepID=UPI003B2199D4
MILFVDVPRHDPLAHDRVAWVPSKAAARADVEQVRRVSCGLQIAWRRIVQGLDLA